MADSCPDTGPDLWLCQDRTTGEVLLCDPNDLDALITALRQHGQFITLVTARHGDFISFRIRFDSLQPYAFAWKL